mgnify:CR=1 FL=1
MVVSDERSGIEKYDVYADVWSCDRWEGDGKTGGEEGVGVVVGGKPEAGLR